MKICNIVLSIDCPNKPLIDDLLVHQTDRGMANQFIYSINTVESHLYAQSVLHTVSQCALLTLLQLVRV